GNAPLQTALQRWAGPAAIAAAGCWMLTASWGKWPDVLIDFGRDLYVAWQLAEGKALYVDVEHVLGGPLSPYLNSLWFRIFGVGLRTLVIANAIVLAAILALLHSLLSEI